MHGIAANDDNSNPHQFSYSLKRLQNFADCKVLMEYIGMIHCNSDGDEGVEGDKRAKNDEDDNLTVGSVHFAFKLNELYQNQGGSSRYL